ncbi:hypothetical protein ACLOJK_004639 [Asimina triloba]
MLQRFFLLLLMIDVSHASTMTACTVAIEDALLIVVVGDVFCFYCFMSEIPTVDGCLAMRLVVICGDDMASGVEWKSGPFGLFSRLVWHLPWLRRQPKEDG